MKWILATCIAGLCSNAMADTVIAVRSAEGHADKVSIRGDWVRMDGMSGNDEYVLGDMASGMVYVVMPDKRSILELKRNGRASKSTLNTAFQKLGSGPAVAGFETTEYELQVNGQSCGTALISAEAGAIPDVGKWLKALDQFDPETMMPEGVGDMIAGQMDPCDRAQIASLKQLAALGMPMKSLDKKGSVEQEVVSINAKASLAADLFQLPAGYQRTTPGAMINDAMSQMQEMMKNVSPEQRQQMEQFMKQFGGQLPR